MILGISNAHPKQVDFIPTVETEARSSSTSLEADSSNSIARRDPGAGLCNSGEVLQYSTCQCFNIMTSYCWNPAGAFGHTNSYNVSCPMGTTCLPSISNSWTAQCVDSTQVATLVVPASTSNCTYLNATAYGPVQVVSQIVGCPSTVTPLSVDYYNPNGNYKLSGTKYPTTNFWLSDEFPAVPSVEICFFGGLQAINVVNAFTGEITTPCTWCT